MGEGGIVMDPLRLKLSEPIPPQKFKEANKQRSSCS